MVSENSCCNCSLLLLAWAVTFQPLYVLSIAERKNSFENTSKEESGGKVLLLKFKTKSPIQKGRIALTREHPQEHGRGVQ